MTLRRPHRLLILSVLFLGVVPLLSSHIIPIYDGLGFPDEPYRYVTPPTPAEQTSQSPSNADAPTPVTNGTNEQGISLTTDELGPQFDLYMAEHTISTDPATTRLDIQVQPKAPQPSDQPSNGKIAGNIYRLSIANGLTAMYHGSPQTSMVNLRLPQGNTGATHLATEYRAQGKITWQTLSTARVGNDIYQSDVVGFGDYALVILSGTTPATTTTAQPATTSSSSHINIIAIALGSLVAIMAGAIAVIRRMSQKRKRPSHERRM